VATFLAGRAAAGTLGPAGTGTSAVPAFPFPEQAVRALGHAARHGRWLARAAGTVPDLPGVDADRARVMVRDVLENAPAEGCWLGAGQAAELLGVFGIPVAPTRMAGDADEAVRVATEIGFPVALKTAASGIAHKTDVGGVVLDLGSADQVREAFDGLAARLGDTMAGAIVQPMIDPGLETIVGVVQDASFGPLVMFGLGGVATDVLGDVAFRILPLADVDASELIRSVRAAPLLFGYRGRPAVDVAALEVVLLRVGALADAIPELSELDLNPVVVSERGVVALDVKLRLRTGAPGPGPLWRRLP